MQCLEVLLGNQTETRLKKKSKLKDTEIEMSYTDDHLHDIHLTIRDIW